MKILIVIFALLIIILLVIIIYKSIFKQEENMNLKYTSTNNVRKRTYEVSKNQIVIFVYNTKEKYLFTFNEDGTLTSSDGTTNILIF